MLWNDEDVRPEGEKLIAHPPVRSQRPVETEITAAVILGSLIAWLQTKVKIRISRKDGKTSLEFELPKATASVKLIKDVINPVCALLFGKPGKKPE